MLRWWHVLGRDPAWPVLVLCPTALPPGPACAACRTSYQDVCILRDMKTYLPVLEIRFLECRGEPVLWDWGRQPCLALILQPLQVPPWLALLHRLLFGGLSGEKLRNELSWAAAGAGGSSPSRTGRTSAPAASPFLADQGCNVRLRGIKIKSFWEWEVNLNADMFQPERLVRYPLLEGMDADMLYRRAVLIQRYSTGTGTGKDSALASSGGYTRLKVLQLLSCVWHRL